MNTLLHIFAAIGVLTVLLVVSVIILVAEDARRPTILYTNPKAKKLTAKPLPPSSP